MCKLISNVINKATSTLWINLTYTRERINMKDTSININFFFHNCPLWGKEENKRLNLKVKIRRLKQLEWHFQMQITSDRCENSTYFNRVANKICYYLSESPRISHDNIWNFVRNKHSQLYFHNWQYEFRLRFSMSIRNMNIEWHKTPKGWKRDERTV